MPSSVAVSPRPCLAMRAASAGRCGPSPAISSRAGVVWSMRAKASINMTCAFSAARRPIVRISRVCASRPNWARVLARRAGSGRNLSVSMPLYITRTRSALTAPERIISARLASLTWVVSVHHRLVSR
ncbi:hypothetical protein D3C81_1535730 [compost metagenome]